MYELINKWVVFADYHPFFSTLIGFCIMVIGSYLYVKFDDLRVRGH